jgi:hypothetical protein
MSNTKPITVRFFAKVEKSDRHDGCWNWTASDNGYGYGQFAMFPGKIIRAHRFSYLFHVGGIPDNLCVLHRCDNRRCVNPSHLFLGTRADNLYDMIAKGREKLRNPRPGKSNGSNTKLTEPDVREILASAASYSSLASQFHVSYSLIAAIKTNRAWKHLSGE